MELSEERILEAWRSYVAICPHTYMSEADFRAGYLAALSSLSTSAERSAVGVKVKPLEWEDRSDDNSRNSYANTNIGRYEAFEFRMDTLPSGPKTIFGWCSRWTNADQPADGFEAAKAAAQADYQARILSALVLETGEAEPVAYRFKVRHDYGWSDWSIAKEVGDLEAYQRDRPQSVLIEPLYASPPSLPASDERLERLVKALEAAETYVIDGVTTAKQNLEMNASYPARKPRYEAELQEARDIYAECQAARRAVLAAVKERKDG